MSRISATPAAMSRNFSNQGDSERLGDLERERDEALEQAKINEEESEYRERIVIDRETFSQ